MTAIHSRILGHRGRRPLLAAVFQHFPPYPGGGAIRAHAFAKALGCEIHDQAPFVVITTVSAPDVGAGDTFTVQSTGGGAVGSGHGLGVRAVSEVGSGILAVFKLLYYRPHFVVISTPGYLFAMVVVAFLRIFRVPYMLDVRDIYPEAYAEAGLVRRGSWAYRVFVAISRFMYTGAKSVIAVTEGLSAHIRAQAPSANVDVVYNGYPRTFRGIRAEKHARFTVCFHGVMGFYQDVESLVALARALERSDVNVVVIGFGRKASIFSDNPPSNLKFLGQLSFDRTISEVSRAHVGLCLRTDDDISKDAVPVKLFEYIGLGLPSLVTPPSEGGRLVQRLGCGSVFDAGDVEGLVAAILELKDEPKLYAQMASACRASGEEFTREFQAQVFSGIVSRIIHADKHDS